MRGNTAAPRCHPSRYGKGGKYLLPNTGLGGGGRAGRDSPLDPSSSHRGSVRFAAVAPCHLPPFGPTAPVETFPSLDNGSSVLGAWSAFFRRRHPYSRTGGPHGTAWAGPFRARGGAARRERGPRQSTGSLGGPAVGPPTATPFQGGHHCSARVTIAAIRTRWTPPRARLFSPAGVGPSARVPAAHLNRPVMAGNAELPSQPPSLPNFKIHSTVDWRS